MASLNLGSTLPVPSVKELVSQHQHLQQPLQSVPFRYVRDAVADHDPYPTADRSSVLAQAVPVLDMAKLVDEEYKDAGLRSLDLACRDWGIFQLINHEVPIELIKGMYGKAQEFFNLSPEDKKIYAQKPGSLEGYGQAFVISEEQKLEWCDMIFLKSLPAHLRKLEFWPEQPHDFRETLHSYTEGMKKTAVSVAGFIAMALGLQSRVFSELFEDGSYDVRMNCYPQCPEPERVIGIASHADISGITLLTDCGDMPGLQVLKDGQWVFIEPITDAIVVNVGNIIEIMSNGNYQSPYHRAAVNRLKDRFSIVTFCYPSAKFDVGPAEALTRTGYPALYKTMTNEEYFQSFYNRNTLGGVPFIDTLKL